MPPQSRFTKEQIVQAGLTIVREHGIEKLTARNLAKQLGSSSCPIFTVFKNMEEVKEQTLRAGEKCYEAYLQDGMKNPLPFIGVGIAYIRFARKERALFRILFLPDGCTGKDLRARFSLTKENEAAILSVICSITGLPEKQADRLYLYCQLFAHSLATLAAGDALSIDEEEATAMLTDVFFGMLERIRMEQREE